MELWTEIISAWIAGSDFLEHWSWVSTVALVPLVVE